MIMSWVIIKSLKKEILFVSLHPAKQVYSSLDDCSLDTAGADPGFCQGGWLAAPKNFRGAQRRETFLGLF